MRTRAGLMAVVVLLAPATRASAEWHVKPFFGAKFGGGTTLVDSEDAAGQAKRTYGVTGAWLGDVFGLEGDVSWIPGFFQSGEQHSVFEPARDPQVISSRVTTITGGLVIAAPQHRTEYTLRPYFVAGGGVIRARAENLLPTFSIASDLPAINVGGGATGFLTKRMGLSWDVRYFHSIRGKPVEKGQSIGADYELLSFWRVNMAFVVRFRHSSQ